MAVACPVAPAASVGPEDAAYASKPMVDGAFKFVGGERVEWTGKVIEVSSAIVDGPTGTPAVIGRIAEFEEADAMAAVEAAAKAWDLGRGKWPQLPIAERIAAVRHYIECLKPVRQRIIDALTWEVFKNTNVAATEFDRTMNDVDAAIETLEESDDVETFGKWTTVAGVSGRVRRSPVGVTMVVAPFDCLLNEMYAMMIPALLMGNVIVVKLPAIGGLAHVLTADALKDAFPPGVVNFVMGPGRKTAGPIMGTGLVDCLGFIGGAKAIDAIIKQHPRPHRLKVFSQVEGKNIAVVLPDADLNVVARTILRGGLRFKGQRSTACQLVMVHESVAGELAARISEGVSQLTSGVPWAITPLHEPAKPAYLEGIIADAVAKGANVVNSCQRGPASRGALHPAVLYPVSDNMQAFTEEQFVPVVPIAPFSDLVEVDAAVRASWNCQQAAIFTHDQKEAARLVDMLSSVVGRINLNSQCSRRPDGFPFPGRRSSAMGTMPVSEALRAFSIETIVAFSESEVSRDLAKGIEAEANFLQPIVRRGKTASEEPLALFKLKGA